MLLPDQATVSEALVLVGELARDDSTHLWAARAGGDQFIGWSEDRALAASTRDILLAIAVGLGGNRVSDSDMWPRPAAEQEQAQTIADFDTGAFARMLAS